MVVLDGGLVGARAALYQERDRHDHHHDREHKLSDQRYLGSLGRPVLLPQ